MKVPRGAASIHSGCPVVPCACRAALAAMLGSLLLIRAAGAVEAVRPGQWRITTRVLMNGTTMPAEVKTRCLTAEQAGDPARTFSPEVAAVNTACERLDQKLDRGRLTWRMRCRGQIDIDVEGEFNFDSPERYIATVRTKAFMAGRPVADSSAAIEGVHAGPCP